MEKVKGLRGQLEIKVFIKSVKRSIMLLQSDTLRVEILELP